jgi:DNA-directed RNA polymerase specialized sigma24 family protein
VGGKQAVQSRKREFFHLRLSLYKRLYTNGINEGNHGVRKNFLSKNEFWENAEAPYTANPQVEDILLQHCHTLTPNQEKWLLQAVFEGLSVNEIAKKEKVSLSAVKNWRKGAQDKLKVALGCNRISKS